MVNRVIRKAAIGLCFIPFFLSASSIGVIHFKAVGVEDATAQVVADLLVNELVNYGNQVLNPEAMDAAAGETLRLYEPVTVAGAGAKAHVERVIYGSVSKLGEKHMVQATVVSVSTQAIVWTGSMAAKTAEDLDIVVKRVAKSIQEGKPVEETVEIGIVTEQEITQDVKRKETFYAAGGNFVFGIPAHGYGEAGLLMGFNALSWYETAHFAVELKAGYAWATSSTEISVLDWGSDISFLYLFKKSDISPYAGGGLGIHFLNLYNYMTGGGFNFGMNFNAGGGLAIFRTSDFHLIIDGRYEMNLADIQDYSSPHGSLKFSLGVVYRTKRGCGCCFGAGCF
jgi:TolB-like protein